MWYKSDAMVGHKFVVLPTTPSSINAIGGTVLRDYHSFWEIIIA